jgi:hypothetical protein
MSATQVKVGGGGARGRTNASFPLNFISFFYPSILFLSFISLLGSSPVRGDLIQPQFARTLCTVIHPHRQIHTDGQQLNNPYFPSSCPLPTGAMQSFLCTLQWDVAHEVLQYLAVLQREQRCTTADAMSQPRHTLHRGL